MFKKHHKYPVKCPILMKNCKKLNKKCKNLHINKKDMVEDIINRSIYSCFAYRYRIL